MSIFLKDEKPTQGELSTEYNHRCGRDDVLSQKRPILEEQKAGPL